MKDTTQTTNITGSSNGRNTDFDSVNRGSNPRPVTTDDAQQLADKIVQPDYGQEAFDECLEYVREFREKVRKDTIEEVAKLFDDQADHIRAHNIREIMRRKTP